jgi:2-methylcitrate dehydratase PrpD
VNVIATNTGVGHTGVLARFAAALTLDDIPIPVQDLARLCLLDGLGCALYGAQLEWGRIAADVAVEMAPGGVATLWGHQSRAGAAAAALANGTALHGFELDDVHVRAMLHPAAVVLPAVLALAETETMSGRALLCAIVAGYEVGIRTGICAGIPHGARGFHATGTVGCVAAAAGVANLLRLGPEQTAHAIGIGATQAAGLYCARAGAMTKRFHAGHAAQAGVIAGLMARRGFTGSQDVLETAFGGFMSTLTENADLSQLIDGLGETWETALVGFKIHAACASAHTIIDGLDVLMQRGLTADNLELLTIHMTGKAARNVGWQYQPGGVVAAQMNGYYAAASKLLDGQVSAAQYADRKLADPATLAMIERMRIVHDPALDAGGTAKRHASRIEATLSNGETLSVFTEQRRGSSHLPLTQDEVIGKFRNLTASVLDAAAIEELLALVLSIDTQPDMTQLSRLLRVHRPSPAQ